MTQRRDPITAEDLRDELEALDEQAYRLQILRQRIDTSIGALHDRVTPDDMANARAFAREAVALWDKLSSIYESHTANSQTVLREFGSSAIARELGRGTSSPVRLPRVDESATG